MYDVAIIGAGVIGAMVAEELARYDLKICIVERENDVAAGASKANSAIVHAGFDAPHGTLKAELNVMGSEMMEKICRDLSVSYQRNGSLVIGFSSEDRKVIEGLLENGIKNGVRDLRIIEADELRALEPNISDEAAFALYAPTGAIVCPYELTEAAVGNAMDNGADLKLNFEVAGIRKINSSFEIESKSGERLTASAVVNAAGLYADKIAEAAGDGSFKIHPRRGEYMLLDKECGGIARHTLFTVPGKMGKGILVSPTVDGNLILGPTSADCSDRENKSTTAQGLAEITEKTSRIVKGIDYRMVITSFCGLRAVGNTGDFIINSPQAGFVNIAGIESPGLSASPAIAVYAAKLLRDGGLELKLKPGHIAKRASLKGFYKLPAEKKNEIIAKDPAFGNIICRCENISEGEILHAIRTNPKPRDLDGVKRRTRAQMGRCQGGFCSVQILKLLSDELKIPMEQITKSGGSSEILLGKTKEAADDAKC